MDESTEVTTLVTGGTGKLGRALTELIPEAEHPIQSMLDIRDKDAIRVYIRSTKPKLIIHCAALTGIRQCEDDKESAWRVNVEGTENLIEACQKEIDDCYFVYVSTACVFYGDKGNYIETDTPNPKNYYALTKLIGESVVRNAGLKRWLIARTNFVAREKWMYPRAFADRFGTYLFADDLALALREVILQNITGVIHIHSGEKISMFELARITTPSIQPMTLEEYQGPPLTVDMTLSSSRIAPFKLRRNP